MMQLVLIVLQNGMKILNVSLPNKMMFSNIVKLLAFIIFLLFFILVFNYYFSEKNLNRVINQEDIQTKMIKNTSDPILKIN